MIHFKIAEYTRYKSISMIVREFADIQAIQKQQNGKKIINLLYLLEEQIRVESVPHVLKHHTFICARRAGRKRNFVCESPKISVEFFAIYHRYLAFLKFEDGVVYRFKISDYKVAVL